MKPSPSHLWILKASLHLLKSLQHQHLPNGVKKLVGQKFLLLQNCACGCIFYPTAKNLIQFTSKKNQWESAQFTGRCVSTYIPALRATNPLFSDATRKFTNTSLRKYHNDSLSEAGAPLIVQQESLAQNTKAYARKASDPTNKQKVAEIVAGERKSWHSPPHPFHATNSTPTHSFSSLPLKKRKIFVSTESNKENEAVASHNQPVLFTSSDNFFKLHFTNGQSTFSFEGKL